MSDMDQHIATINDFRRRILAGEEPSREELANAILALRSSRAKAAVTSAEAKAKKSTAPIDLNALFGPKPDAAS